jgi:cyclase
MRQHTPFLLFGALIGCGALALAQGQQQQGLTTHKLKDNVYWIEGGGGNTGVIVGTNGVIIVDAKTTAMAGKQILDEVAKITPKPVTHVILTHSDGDHVNGLASFPKGLTIVAQAGCAKEMQDSVKAGGRGAAPADYLPTMVITKSPDDVTFDGVKLRLLHWAPAHTSGDLVIYLPAEKIVFTGDIIAANRPDPIIHPEKGGNSEGWVTTAKGIAALDSDQFVPGHGDLQSKADIQKRVKDTVAKRDKIKSLIAQGKSLDEIQQAVGDPAPAAGGGGRGGPAFASLSQIVYQESKGGTIDDRLANPTPQKKPN